MTGDEVLKALVAALDRVEAVNWEVLANSEHLAEQRICAAQLYAAATLLQRHAEELLQRSVDGVDVTAFAVAWNPLPQEPSDN